jgi:hypothetical protein
MTRSDGEVRIFFGSISLKKTQKKTKTQPGKRSGGTTFNRGGLFAKSEERIRNKRKDFRLFRLFRILSSASDIAEHG